MAAFIQVAGQKHAKLPRRKIDTVAANQGDDRITQNSDQLVGRKLRRHLKKSFPSQVTT
jgi:hypothetical protein